MRVLDMPRVSRLVSFETVWLAPIRLHSPERLEECGVIDSQLMRLWLDVFDNEFVETNMTAGFGLPNGDRTWELKGKCCVSVADWEQHVRGFNLMGYTGIVPCGCCMNVLGRRPDFDDPVLVHIFQP